MSASLTYAVGDVHGNVAKLRNLLGHCLAHCGESAMRMVFLGDYIDRGAHSREVVEMLMGMQTRAPDAIICLKGNHEDMLLTAARHDGKDEAHWLVNGGDTTLDSYGVDAAADIPAAHLAWLASLPLTTSDENRLYVHGGVRPGVPLQEQTENDLLWIREPFLSDPRDHGLLIVHGHTPRRSGTADLRANRLNLDTGAYFGGPLTAAVFDAETRGPRAFITDDGTVRPAPQSTNAEPA
jgi:serine/threonine protein phosphatase 1